MADEQLDDRLCLPLACGRSVPGCSGAVRAALTELVSLSKVSRGMPTHRMLAVRSLNGPTPPRWQEEAIEALGLCTPLPAYLQAAGEQEFFDELNMVFMYTFAGLNMGNYPPEGSALQAACSSMVSATAEPLAALKALLMGYSAPPPHGRVPVRRPRPTSADDACFDLAAQLPAGRNPTISGGDWYRWRYPRPSLRALEQSMGTAQEGERGQRRGEVNARGGQEGQGQGG